MSTCDGPFGSFETLRIGTLSFSAASRGDAVATVRDAALAGGGAHVHLANTYVVALASKDPRYATAFSGGVCFPDGRPLTWMSKSLRGQVNLTQVRGVDLFTGVMEAGIDTNLRHYLLGSTPETLLKLRTAIESRIPNASIVGAYSPPFRPLTAAEQQVQDNDILASGAQIVWVGLGTPKQDFEVRRISEEVGLVAIAVGAAFDFVAGTVPESPRFLRQIGMEWAYRLFKEPRRLWRRYLFGNTRFIKLWILAWRDRK